MKLIKADHNHRLQIPGVPDPVLRPVDIDKAKTGFETLRSLRIYRFDAGSVIDGHAEEDEVMIVLLAGSIELTLIDEEAGGSAQTYTLSAVTEKQGAPCAAYLPPLAAYHLVALTDADVAYARATPADGPPYRVFNALEEEVTYPRLLRLRIVELGAGSTQPLPATNAEALLHIKTNGVVTVAGATLASWDTLAIAPGESPVLHVAEGSSALVLIVQAPSRP
jgi:hypothetical protein